MRVFEARKWYRRCRDAVRALRDDQRGTTLALMTMGLIPGIAAIGAGIDAGRLYIVKSQLQAGVDAAALAGARAFGVTDTSGRGRAAQVNAYFDGNFSRSPSTYMGTTAVTVTPSFDVVNGINVTTVRATATVRMSFMRVFGFTEQTMYATAKAELQPRPLEVMVVLDNTGSMKANLSAGRTRITALKEAATSFVDILFQGATTRKDLALGFVPYDITVNVGKLLQQYRSNAVASVDGFNAGLITYAGAWPSNPFAWKGCVMNDTTVRDVGPDRTVSENGAWDVTRTLPGEGGSPAVQPYYVPPMWVPLLQGSSAANRQAAIAAAKADPASDYYKVANVEPKNNLFRADNTPYGDDGANYLVNTGAMRGYFYDYYIGLNNGAGTAGDDVIRVKDSGAYFDPATGNRASTNWYVDWKRIPNYASVWSNVQTSSVNPDGGKVDDGSQNQTLPPSPNWQCPEEAMLPLYNRDKSTYTDYITKKNGAIYPANGTIHHAGLLWAYRLLVRSDVFTRPRPADITTDPARRAIVFMTDGLNEVGENQNGWLDRTFTWYGRWSDSTLSANPADAETQMLRRFEKTCANIQREANPPEVYIIALVANSTAVNTAFDNCAPGRVYRTSSTAQLTAAFQDVAGELVDLHLVQ